jgi:hypothetical protein
MAWHKRRLGLPGVLNFGALISLRQLGQNLISPAWVATAILIGASSVQAAQSVSTAPKTSPAKVRISQSAVNSRSAVLWIADNQGFFARSNPASFANSTKVVSSIPCTAKADATS